MTQTTQPINSIQAAWQHFSNVVREIEGLKVLKASQPFAYCIKANTVDWLGDYEKVGNFYIFFKRDHYHTFAKAYPNLPSEYRQIGQTITLEALKRAADDPPSYIVIVMPAGEIYYLKAQTWYEWATTYGTVRQASNSDARSLEASIPIKLLKRLNP